MLLTHTVFVFGVIVKNKGKSTNGAVGLMCFGYGKIKDKSIDDAVGSMCVGL